MVGKTIFYIINLPYLDFLFSTVYTNTYDLRYFEAACIFYWTKLIFAWDNMRERKTRDDI